jgi:hypothetical protein
MKDVNKTTQCCFDLRKVDKRDNETKSVNSLTEKGKKVKLSLCLFFLLLVGWD